MEVKNRGALATTCSFGRTRPVRDMGVRILAASTAQRDVCRVYGGHYKYILSDFCTPRRFVTEKAQADINRMLSV